MLTVAGWTIELSPDLEYEVYLSAPGVHHPTYSWLVPLPALTLQPGSHTSVTFTAVKFVKLRRKVGAAVGFVNSISRVNSNSNSNQGLLERRDHCSEGTDYAATVRCEKRCLLDRLNVGNTQQCSGVSGPCLVFCSHSTLVCERFLHLDIPIFADLSVISAVFTIFKSSIWL